MKIETLTERVIAAHCELHLYLFTYRQKFGTKSPIMAGGFYAHWPEDTKIKIRALNRLYNSAMDEYIAAKPRGRHMRTWIKELNASLLALKVSA